MDTSLKLLVIDDEELMLSLFEAVMAERGHVIATAHSGIEGLEMARTGQFDVVISDIKMPDMTGIQVLEKIRQESEDIGVVLITGYASLNTAIDALRLGADAYLFKPFEDFERDVMQVIERTAQKHRLARENKALALELNEANEHLKRSNLKFRRTMAQLSAQQQMAAMLSNATDVERVAVIADQALVAGFETHAYALLACDGDGRFELVRGARLGACAGEPVSVEAGSGVLGAALAEQRVTQLDPGAFEVPGRESWVPEHMAALVVPCIAAGAKAGALVVFDPDAGLLFAHETVSMYAAMAAQVAAPLALIRLHEAGVAR